MALEPEFWAALADLAEARSLTQNALIVDIDRDRGEHNLASACRLAVLRHLRRRPAE